MPPQDIAQDDAEHLCRCAKLGKPSALDPAEPFTDGVHLNDVRPTGEQLAGEQAVAIVEKYHLNFSEKAMELLRQETPKALDNVTTQITGIVLRMVFISTMSAPQASSWRVMSCNSSPETSGCSNSALPPPESRKRTVSSGFISWATRST